MVKMGLEQKVDESVKKIGVRVIAWPLANGYPTLAPVTTIRMLL
jgi:hypothetical protein